MSSKEFTRSSVLARAPYTRGVPGRPPRTRRPPRAAEHVVAAPCALLEADVRIGAGTQNSDEELLVATHPETHRRQTPPSHSTPDWLGQLRRLVRQHALASTAPDLALQAGELQVPELHLAAGVVDIDADEVPGGITRDASR